jgi:hypothetical protein
MDNILTIDIRLILPWVGMFVLIMGFYHRGVR